MSRFLKALLGPSTAVSVTLAAGAAPVAFPPAKVSLPDDTVPFSGSGADVVNQNCLGCHSSDMVLNQPALTKAAWQAEVTKMVNVYKAPVDPAAVDAIVDYLDRTKGKH